MRRRDLLRRLLIGTALCGALLVPTSLPASPQEPAAAPKLTVGVLQLALKGELAQNRDKIVHFIAQAKAKGCRVVVFPETALYSPPETAKADIDAAIAVVQKAAAAQKVYVIFCVKYQRHDKDTPFERLLVIDPDGRVIHTYDKFTGDGRRNPLPGLFAIDGIPASAAICADRWLRGVEELPALKASQILFELSNNHAKEWIEDLGWYWYVPRALRNQAFVVFANTAKENPGENRAGHGHSAVIAPDGSLIASAGEESDRLVVATLDLAQATRGEALQRRNHPLFKPFWDVGLRLLDRASVEVPAVPIYRAPKTHLTLAAAQMPCSRNVADNVSRMKRTIRAARAKGADLVAFPELAVTGAVDADIKGAEEAALQAALGEIQAAAKAEGIYVVFGMPSYERGKRQNCAFVVGPDGTLLTRYAQIVVDRLDLFAPGTDTKSLWFKVKGVPAVVTVGGDALWSEIAELAAVRGAQVHIHLCYDRDTSAAGTLRRRQLWVNLASYRTFSATVNAASPADMRRPSAPANGGSILWDDYHRGSLGKAGGYAPWSAVRLAQAGTGEEILYATQDVPDVNPHFARMSKTNPRMESWYRAGAHVIAAAEPVTGRNGLVPFDGRTFKGRIAWSADGNHNDPDDWAASPVALAIFAECGVRDRLVHFDYNCILPRTDAEWEKKHADSVLGAATRYGYAKSVFHDCRKDLKAALASITKAINDSTADNPLYFIIAGPMEVPVLGIQKSDPDKRKFVYCISHSRWNDGFASKYKFTHTKRSVIALGVNWVQIQDQNRLLSFGKYGQPSTKEEEWRPYHWMRDSDDPKVRFLWERMRVSTRPDPSDAGMAYFLMTGDEEVDPAKLKRLLDDNVVPGAMQVRSRIRLEAENFRDLENYELEDRNDKGASHRLQVKLALGKKAGRIRTLFNEPYTASRGRYEVDVRFLDERDQRCRFTLLVNALAQGAAWESPAKGQGWTTHTIPDVEIRAGDEIAVSAQGESGKLDYVQLNYRKPKEKGHGSMLGTMSREASLGPTFPNRQASWTCLMGKVD